MTMLPNLSVICLLQKGDDRSNASMMQPQCRESKTLATVVAVFIIMIVIITHMNSPGIDSTDACSLTKQISLSRQNHTHINHCYVIFDLVI